MINVRELKLIEKFSTLYSMIKSIEVWDVNKTQELGPW